MYYPFIKYCNHKTFRYYMETAAGQVKNKTRDANIELLRIIAMLMIVALHYLAHGEGLVGNQPFSFNWTFAWALEAVCIVAVNCYVLISGYFLVTSQFKIKKLIRLWIQVLFYSITIYLVLIALGLEPFTIKHLAMACVPVLTNQYWFVTVYLALYIVSPFLNILIHALSRKQFQNLLIILFTVLSLWPTVLPFGFSLDKTNGLSIIQFIFLYFIASYIRLYWNHNIRSGYYLGTYILLTVIIAASKFILTLLGFRALSGMFFEFNSVTVILSSVMLFMYFRNVSIKSTVMKKIFCSVSALTFGVYLIHEDIFLRGILYKNVLHTDLYINTSNFIPVSIITITGIFTLCICIDYTRRQLFTAFEHSMLSDKVIKYFSALSSKLPLSPKSISTK
ncbi:MAG: acyltransferase [Bacteroidota bacterium]